MKTNHYAGIDPHIVNVIEREAGKLRGRCGLTAADLADIRQDMHLAVWSALGKLGGEVNREAAVNRIVGNLIKNLIRDRQRECRDWRREAMSMNEACPAEGGELHEDMAQVMDLEGRQHALYGRPPSWHECRGEAADIAEAMANLPGDLRVLAATLEAAEGNLSDVARSLGVTPKRARTMLRDQQRAMEWLREDRSAPPNQAVSRILRKKSTF